MSAVEESLVTAYALDELEGAELAQVEWLLQRNPAMRAQVEAIQNLAAALGAALADEAIPRTASAGGSTRFPAFLRWSLAIAAAVILGFCISHFAVRQPISIHRAGPGKTDQTEGEPPATVLAKAVPQAALVRLPLGSRTLGGSKPELLSLNPVWTTAEWETPVISPPNADLRLNCSLERPIGDGPQPDDLVHYYIPDPGFDRADPFAEEARLLVKVPSLDLDRRALVWVVPSSRPRFHSKNRVQFDLDLQTTPSLPTDLDLRLNFSYRSPAPDLQSRF